MIANLRAQFWEKKLRFLTNLKPYRWKQEQQEQEQQLPLWLNGFQWKRDKIQVLDLNH